MDDLGVPLFLERPIYTLLGWIIGRNRSWIRQDGPDGSFYTSNSGVNWHRNYPPTGTITYPILQKGKVIDSNVPTGRGYVCFQEGIYIKILYIIIPDQDMYVLGYTMYISRIDGDGDVINSDIVAGTYTYCSWLETEKQKNIWKCRWETHSFWEDRGMSRNTIYNSQAGNYTYTYL